MDTFGIMSEYLYEHDKPMGCPRCESTTGLYQDVSFPGWQSVEAFPSDDGPLVYFLRGSRGDAWDVETYENEPVSDTLRCGNCDWVGESYALKPQLRVGTDGKHIKAPIEGQLDILDE